MHQFMVGIHGELGDNVRPCVLEACKAERESVEIIHSVWAVQERQGNVMLDPAPVSKLL